MSEMTTNLKALDIFNNGETNRSTVHAGRFGDLFWFSDAEQKTIRATLAQQAVIERLEEELSKYGPGTNEFNRLMTILIGEDELRKITTEDHL